MRRPNRRHARSAPATDVTRVALQTLLESIPSTRTMLRVTRSELELLLRMAGFDPERAPADHDQIEKLVERFQFAERPPNEIRRPAYIFGCIMARAAVALTDFGANSGEIIALSELFGARTTLIDLTRVGHEPFLRPEELVRFGHGALTVLDAALLLETSTHDLLRAGARGEVALDPSRKFVAAASVRDQLARMDRLAPKRQRQRP